MTNIDTKGFSEADLIRMQEGKKELPIGISRIGNGRNGYRLHRTIKGKTYRFGSFQNFEHALRVNEYIGRLIDDLREVLDAQPLSKEELENVISIQSVRFSVDLHEMEDRMTMRILNALELQQPIEKKSFWQRILSGMKNNASTR